jgi:hypothetical protein
LKSTFLWIKSFLLALNSNLNKILPVGTQL